jgi:hypothetical protein
LNVPRQDGVQPLGKYQAGSLRGFNARRERKLSVGLSSLVYLPSMANAGYFHKQFCIVNGVDSTIFPHTDTPFIVTALRFLAAWRTGVECQILQTQNDSCDQLPRQLFSSFSALDVRRTR